MGKTVRRLVVPVTFLTSGTPRTLLERVLREDGSVLLREDGSRFLLETFVASALKLRRKWKVNVAFIDALELASTAIVNLLGLKLGTATAAAAAQAVSGLYEDGEMYGFSEDA